MIFPRNITPALEKEIRTKEIIVLTGMRQVGKTTLLTHIYNMIDSNNKAFLDAGNPIHRKVFDEVNYDAVIQNLAAYGITNPRGAFVFIDEIQFMPEISNVIKYLYDHYRIKFFLTGSSSFYLKNLFPESLAGRKIVFEAFPLTFGEFLVFKKVEKTFKADFPTKEAGKNRVSSDLYAPYYREYIEYGGFPSVALEKNPARKKQLLEGIFRSYFEIDVRNLSDFREISKVNNLILLLCARVGSRLDIAKLSSELGVGRETVYSYLAFLEQTYFISLLPKYSQSIDRASAGSKKLYLCDTGLARFLGSLSEGQLLENSVYQNLRPQHKLSYFTKRSGAELDFIVDGDYALEVKQTPSRRDVENAKRLASELHLKDGFVISRNYSDLDGVLLAQDL